MSPTEYDHRVFQTCTAICTQVFPVTLDTDRPGFRGGLDRLFVITEKLGALKAEKGVVASLRRTGLKLSAAATFARLYMLPGKQRRCRPISAWRRPGRHGRLALPAPLRCSSGGSAPARSCGWMGCRGGPTVDQHGGCDAVLLAALWGLRPAARMPRCSAPMRLLLRAARLGLAGDGLPDGLRDRPARAPCPPDASGWRRFTLALRAILYHELAILAGAVAVVAVTWGAAEPGRHLDLPADLGDAAERQAQRLPRRAQPEREFPAAHLRYLGSFFRGAPMNLLFPFAVTAATC